MRKDFNALIFVFLFAFSAPALAEDIPISFSARAGLSTVTGLVGVELAIGSIAITKSILYPNGDALGLSLLMPQKENEQWYINYSVIQTGSGDGELGSWVIGKRYYSENTITTLGAGWGFVKKDDPNFRVDPGPSLDLSIGYKF